MIKTVSLTANQETEVILAGGCHCCIENRGSGVIYASKSADIVPDSEGVTAIDSGNSKVLRNIAQYKKGDDNSSYDYYGKIYLLSDTDTKAEIQTANDLNFFSRKNTAKGGGTYDDTAIKADIDDLQTGKANKSEVYTKTESDHKICKVVCGKNTGAGWFKIGETICNTARNTVGVTLIINPTYEGPRNSDYNRTINSTIILTIGARYQDSITDPDKMIGIKNDVVVKPYDIYGTIFDENCVYVNYENETLSIYLKTLQNSQAYVITALSGYSSYLAPDVSYAWTFVNTNEPIELPTTGIGVYATDVTKSKYDSANNIIADTYVTKKEGKGLSSNDYTTAEKNKLAGIATGANKTVVDTALSTTSTNPVQNKVINTALNNKVDKVSGKSLISDTEIARLSTVENYDDTEIRNMISMSTDPVITVYVDGTNGNDNNDGSTKAKAFKTLEKAIQLLNKTNNLSIYCATGIYDITSDGYITTTLTRGKTLHLTNYNRTTDNITDVTIRGCIRSYLGCSLMCTYITLESVELSNWGNVYGAMYYIGEMARAYIAHCVINNNHYESTISVSSSNLSIIDVTINNNSTNTNKYSLRGGNSIVHIKDLTDDTATANVYVSTAAGPNLIMSNKSLTTKGTNTGLTVVNGQIQG